MTTNYLILANMNEDQDSGDGQIAWPGTTAGPLGAPSNLVISGGETILKNRGYNLTYTSEDGTQTLKFGQYLDGTTVSGLTSGNFFSIDGSHTGYYDGPWCVVPGNLLKLLDPVFVDIEVWGDVDWYSTYNPVAQKTTFPVHLRSGTPIMTDQQIADYAITQNHFGPSVAEYGHLAGATGIVPNAPHSPFYFGTNSANDVFDFKTKDGSGGDGANITAWPGPKGGSFLLNTSSQGFFPGGVGYPVGPVIMDTNATANLASEATWPYSGTATAPVPGSVAHPGSPADAIVTFCTYFPGGPTASSFVGGSLLASTYTLAFAFVKSLAVPGTYAGNATTYTQVIETPLSSPLSVTVAGGQGVQFSIPPTPTGWTSVRIYAKNQVWSGGGTFFLQTLGVNYTLVGNTITFTSFANSGVRTSSHGFAAWPAGTNLTDTSAVRVPLMPIGHMPHTETGRGTWPFMPYNSALDTQEQHSIGAGVIQTDHLNTSNIYSSGNVLGRDINGNLAWVGGPGSAISSLSNGANQFSLDSAGHLVLTGTSSPFIGSITFSGAATGSFNSATLIGRDQFFYLSFSLSAISNAAVNISFTCNWGTSYPAGQNLFMMTTPANQPAVGVGAFSQPLSQSSFLLRVLPPAGNWLLGMTYQFAVQTMTWS